MHFASCSIKKNYGGVAILYNQKALGKHLAVSEGMGHEELDCEGRLLRLEFEKFNLISVYTPHSGVGDLKRLDYRVNQWDRAFEKYCADLPKTKDLIVCGDLNIIRHDHDIYNRKGAEGRPALTVEERDSFEQILENCSLSDAFRKLYPLR
jgi:exodeoxyribonuclease III